MSKVIVPWDLITNFVTDAFIGYGIPAEDAKICTDVLLESDRRGIESHGCNRFKPIYLDRIKAGIQNPVTQFEILKETHHRRGRRPQRHGSGDRPSGHADGH